MGNDSPWVVLKFGGTSVSSVANWQNIARVLRARLDAGLRPVVVHSALSGITDQLEALPAAAMNGGQSALLAQIENRHRELAAQLGVAPGSDFDRHVAELRQIASGIALVGEVSDRVRARLLAMGELLATLLGAEYLRSQAMEVTWVDARTVLKSDHRRGANARSGILSATCVFEPDPELQQRCSAPGHVFITQGFIAGDAEGNTVLLGRGGSDTSGAYFAAKLQACRLEIWTDVPGMFSANPRTIPSARLLKALHYDEAQEIASNGAKVLHPRCILPVRQYAIPLHVYATQTPELEGTIISAAPGEGAAQVKAIAMKKGITLISMESPGMWHEVGFLADAFRVFKDHGMSVDLVSTSETNVTVSLDPGANTLDPHNVQRLLSDLGRLCRARLIGPCACLSLLGRNIRAILHRLGDALELFEEQKIYLVSQAANDLNFTFVIDEGQGERLVQQLHDLLIRAAANDPVMGPTWEQIYSPAKPRSDTAERWWRNKRALLLRIGAEHEAAYVYDAETIDRRVADLRGMKSVDRVLYSVKANPHAGVLQRVVAGGAGLECVSQGELEHVFANLPSLGREQVLFTPNFAPRHEYEFAFQQGVWVTLDNIHPLREWPELFRRRDVFVRIDTGHGRGHHDHVRTAGARTKFGVPLFELEELARLAEAAEARVIGLHAHTGSGIFNARNWIETAELLTGLRQRFREVRVVDAGGGLGIPERPGQLALDLQALDAALAHVRQQHPSIEIWLEPGRFVVAEAGVLLAQVTQLKGKGEVRYVGVATGMNSLIRPALYGSHHEIVNLTRLDEPATEMVDVVGPICESADQLGNDRLLPPTREGDVLLIANTGAYGHAMSSSYNLRAPAPEFLI
ncbi:MAG TPA: bifunctional aspartate kinase/diaminopimelate decarboxylase [Steroidobacteraceae bacterium]|nr:bifunctional aspartate kinase/diaminopimelate decarboxylase [Steroidobacteraceae bacterium]